MSLNSQKFSLSAAVSAGVIYAACTLFVALFPSASIKLMGWLFHLSSAASVFGSMRVSFGDFIGSLLEVTIYLYVTSLIFVWIFNRSVKHQ
mgnify:CR=1 FL=1